MKMFKREPAEIHDCKVIKQSSEYGGFRSWLQKTIDDRIRVLKTSSDMVEVARTQGQIEALEELLKAMGEA